MNLDFDLFVSGSPNGDQRWPNNSEDSFCKQFFSLETDTPNACDFFIEVRESPEKQLCCYYSYVHRKDVFGLVNGQKRKGAYFAMILRFKGIYCDRPRNIFSLMDMVYRNKIVGSVLEGSSSGEAYLVESLEARTDKFREVENLFANQLSVIVNDLKVISSSFAVSQSGMLPEFNLYEKDDSVILDALKKHLKVHLLAFTNDKSGVIDSYKTKIAEKEKELETLNNKYAALLAEKKRVDDALNATKGELAAASQKNKELHQEIEDLKSKLAEASNFPLLHNWILEYAKKHNAEESQATSGGSAYGFRSHTHSHHQSHSNGNDGRESGESGILSFLKKYWPWILSALVALAAFVLAFLFFNPFKKDVVVTDTTDKDLQQEVVAMKSELQNARDSLAFALSALAGEDMIPVPYNNIKIDIDPIRSNIVTDKAGVVPAINNKSVKCVVVEGNEFATLAADNSTLNVIKEGSVTLAVMNDGQEVPGSRRVILVKKSAQ